MKILYVVLCLKVNNVLVFSSENPIILFLPASYLCTCTGHTWCDKTIHSLCFNSIHYVFLVSHGAGVVVSQLCNHRNDLDQSIGTVFVALFTFRLPGSVESGSKVCGVGYGLNSTFNSAVSIDLHSFVSFAIHALSCYVNHTAFSCMCESNSTGSQILVLYYKFIGIWFSVFFSCFVDFGLIEIFF